LLFAFAVGAPDRADERTDMNARFFFASTLPLVSTPLLGCNFDFDLGESTPGALHQANFAYVSGECLFGCAVDQAMMVGSEEQILVTGDGLPDELHVKQDPQGIISTSIQRSRSCCVDDAKSSSCSPVGDSDVCPAKLETTFTLTVHALKAGTTALLVVDTHGALVDFVMVEAKEPSQVAVSCAPASGATTEGPLDTIHLGVGDRCDLSVEALDEGGRPLRASSGFSLAIEDAKVAVLRPSIVLLDFEGPDVSDVLASSTGMVLARAAGATVVNVRAAALTRVVPGEGQ
jgi:hypothetical protein